MPAQCCIGVDMGTSGCRALAVAGDGRVVASARAALPAPVRLPGGGVEQDPELWWQALTHVLRGLGSRLGAHRPAALCLDGTSGTLLLCAADGSPLGPALMYNDGASHAEAARIGAAAPADSPARGAGASLAKAMRLIARLAPPAGSRALHQADWLLGRLLGRFDVSDWNNVLKLGYDAQALRWPDWVLGLGLEAIALPRVLPPGTSVGRLDRAAAAATGLPEGLTLATGTTDSTAAFIATGATEAGEAVTCLGSTLVLKVLSPTPIRSPGHGVYSQRVGESWLVGGASNSGGAVLRRFFSDGEMAELGRRLLPEEPTGLDYYPLPAPGERFPVADPALAPRLSPRPADDLRFFQGLLEGIAAIEAKGYRLLRALGAPAPTRVLSTGGGARNRAWGRIRQRILGVPVCAARHQEAAYGAALLALRSVSGSRRQRD
jgi:sugar (pentulose or hexulose) kinase